MRTIIALTLYTAGWSAFLTSDLVEVGGALTFPPFAVIAATTIALAHIALGFAIRRWRALAACAVAPGLALALARWVPADPDIPQYPGLIALCGILLAPVAAALLAVGVALGKRRAARRPADGANAPACAPSWP